MKSTPPKMPRLMKKVYAQIFEHPQFISHVPDSMKFAIRIAGGGWSYCTRQNNKWVRSIWKYLFWPEAPPPVLDEDFLGKFNVIQQQEEFPSVSEFAEVAMAESVGGLIVAVNNL